MADPRERATPLEAMRMQILAMMGQCEALLATLDSLSARPSAPTVPQPSSGYPSIVEREGARRRFMTFDGEVMKAAGAAPAPAPSSEAPQEAPLLAPNEAGDIERIEAPSASSTSMEGSDHGSH